MRYDLVIVGLNHYSAPVEVREKLAIADERLDQINRSLCTYCAVEEAAAVSTCNRVELVACARNGDEAVEQMQEVLRRAHGEDPADIGEYFYTFRGREAVRHLFRVASSLDSMVVGEPQILGQMKELYARAAGAGTTGTILHRCFHKAFSVAKRVRTETGIAGRAVSVSSAAVELAVKIFERLDDKTAMLIGTGEMGRLAARHLLGNGVGDLMVTNRTFERAVELAREIDSTPVRFEQFRKYLPMADIVIGSTAASEFVLTVPLIEDALRERRGRPIFCIDMSVPRNFDPQLNDVDNVYLYDVDDLGRITEDNLGARADEAEKAETIVAEEVDHFLQWLAGLDVVPTIIALRKKVETVRRRELDRAFGALKDLSDKDRKVLEAMTSAIVNKIIHTPLTRLKEKDQRTESYYVDAARRLFDLEGSEES